MEKKNVLSLGLLLLALIVIGGSVYYLYTQRDTEVIDEDSRDDDTSVDIESPYENLELFFNYVEEEEIWEYQVTGTLPNPCYEITTEVEVTEDLPLPDQVKVISLVKSPSEDEICIQVVQEVYEEGTFKASESAQVIHSIEAAPSLIDAEE